jgi:hypothetical protein
LSGTARTRQPLIRRRLALAFVILASLASLTFVVASPIDGTAISTGNGVAAKAGPSYLALPLVLVLLQLFSALIMLSVVILILRERFLMAKRLILVGAVLGLSVVPAQSALALAAYFIIGNSAPATHGEPP